MEVILAVVVMAVVVSIAWLWNRGMAPAPNAPLTHEFTRALLEALLYRGIHGGELSICLREDSSRAVRLTKYIHAPDDVGIQLRVDEAEWAAERYDRFLRELDSRSISYTELTAHQPRVVTLDLKQDLGQAQFIVNIFFEQVLGVRPAIDGVGYLYRNVLPMDIPRLARAQRPRGA